MHTGSCSGAAAAAAGGSGSDMACDVCTVTTSMHSAGGGRTRPGGALGVIDASGNLSGAYHYSDMWGTAAFGAKPAPISPSNRSKHHAYCSPWARRPPPVLCILLVCGAEGGVGGGGMAALIGRRPQLSFDCVGLWWWTSSMVTIDRSSIARLLSRCR